MALSLRALEGYISPLNSFGIGTFPLSSKHYLVSMSLISMGHFKQNSCCFWNVLVMKLQSCPFTWATPCAGDQGVFWSMLSGIV